ncbi:MAG: hypothetical protein IT581_19735 [Verrucomicrobiales bacterium]|nr:hypothetical protein [Verrucomicrobiales bacterium]
MKTTTTSRKLVRVGVTMMGVALGALGVLSLGSVQGSLGGGAYTLDGNLAGGGGLSKGGNYTLVGAVTQPGTGGSAGGNYELTAGLFGPIVVRLPGTPGINMRFTDDKLAELSWEQDATGFVLEFSATVGPDANWQPVSPQPTGQSFITPCQQPARFFRFRKP